MGLAEFLTMLGCPTRNSPKLVSAAYNEPAKQYVKDNDSVKGQQGRPKPAPKRTVNKFERSNLSASADAFHPQKRTDLSASADVFHPERPIVDPNEPQWAQFLANKAYETRPQVASTLAKNAASAAQGTFTLQTSEYLKLLQSGDQRSSNKSKAAKTSSAIGFNNAPLSTDNLKSDLAGALDSIIRSHWAAETDSKDKKKKSSPLKRMVKPDPNGTGNKEDALWQIAQMLDSKDEVGVQEEVVVTACDDIAVEKQNRDEDLAELAYWSDDNQAPQAIRRASAHKIGNLPLDNRSIREYVTQKVGPDLDRNVAMLLLHLRRLNERHRTFEPVAPARRRYVVGIKEVFRGVRNSKVKCIVVAPDIEELSSAGALDDRLKDLLKVAFEQDVPVIFSLSRVRIGRALGKSLRMSVLAILDTTGCNDLYESTIALAYEKRVAWLAEQPKPLPIAPAASQQRKQASGNKGAGKGKSKGRGY